MFDVTVEIGKTDPPHLGHYGGSESYYFLAPTHLRLVGSAGFAPNLRVALSFQQRRLLLEAGSRLRRYPDVRIFPLRDYGDDEAWKNEVRRIVYSVVPEGSKVLLIGANKDESSYYLRLFPEWSFYEAPLTRRDGEVINASDIRLAWLEGRLDEKRELMDEYAYQFFSSLQGGAVHLRLRDELSYIRSNGFPKLIEASDAVVLCRGHLLLEERTGVIGQGLLSLPGVDDVANASSGDLLSSLNHRVDDIVTSPLPDSLLLDSSVEMKSWRVYGSKTTVRGYLGNLELSTLPDLREETARWIPLSDLPKLFPRVWGDQMLLIEKLLDQTFL